MSVYQSHLVPGVSPSVVRRLPAGRLRERILLDQESYLETNPRTYSSARTRIGCTFAGCTQDFIQRFIYVFGVWEPNITAWMGAFLRHADVVIDVGANIGYHSLLAKKSVGATGKIIAFEPLSVVADALVENARRNGVDVDLRRTALGDERGTKTIHRDISGNLGRSNTIGGGDLVPEAEVEVVRGCDAIPEGLWPAIRLIKVDVEGDEFYVLRGLEAVLSELSSGSAVLVEIAPADLELRGQSSQQVLEYMDSFGFTPFSISNSYEAADYAREVRGSPVPLTRAPRKKLDVIFIKGTGR
jgi:FkbM family methyltransferase